MKNSTKWLLGIYFALAGALGLGKIAVDNHKAIRNYRNLEKKIVTEYPNIKRINKLELQLSEYKNSSNRDKDYLNCVRRAQTNAQRAQEYAMLISDEENKRILEYCSELEEKEAHCDLKKVFSSGSAAVLTFGASLFYGIVYRPEQKDEIKKEGGEKVK